MLECVDLKKSYGRLQVLKGINFEIKRGEKKVIIGPSGSGKSTFLRIMGFLEPPTEGRIFFKGEDVYASRLNLNLIRSKIGFVFQEPSLFRHLTCLENVKIGLKCVLKMRDKEATEKAIEALKAVKMEEWADYYPAQLSGGQQQRVGIARALARDPEILLFDEPTASLDVELTWEVIDVMRDLARRGVTMLIVTHEIAFAKEVADEILFMNSGRIIESGPPEQILTNPRTPRVKEFLKRLVGGT
ncbi:MAG: amino acid ABC transporter ATP-binding protein [Candidatus Methanodesulfokora sp.]